MDKTKLTEEVAELFRLNGHSVTTSVRINSREIDVVARELQGLIQKTILIECADYGRPVGVDKIQEDIRKLSSAREELGETAILAHVSRNGYTQDASGYALRNGISAMTFDDLASNLVNFDPYISAIEKDRLRPIILKEYQQTTAFSEKSGPTTKTPALQFLNNWVSLNQNYLIILGDYGVGKSWLLKRYLYELLERYKKDKSNAPLPFFVPLQKFTKSFDFQNLILKTFETYNLSGVHYRAFHHLIQSGRVIMLLDSFDEMAQHLGRSIIRENLTALFEVATSKSKIIMTSRPNYFENKAERLLLVERVDLTTPHEIDKALVEAQIKLSKQITSKLEDTNFARLNDLTPDQRKKLFSVVLSDKPTALKKLTSLLKQFQALNHLSQRAVIARLLTTVAETLASPDAIETVDGQPLLPPDIDKLNQAKIFEIVVYNLLQRDQGIGYLSGVDRLRFLKRFAIYLQRRGSDLFATPTELRELVRDLFSAHLKRSDTPEQDLENFYRSCRRHSGLTTESQFYDTSGIIDLPVSETDVDSRVGFSHNSLREYLVALNFVDAIKGGDVVEWAPLLTASITDLTLDFVVETAEYQDILVDNLQTQYSSAGNSRTIELLFEIIARFLRADKKKYVQVLGSPPEFKGVDLSLVDLSEVHLANAKIRDCLVQDTDFTKCNLKGADFRGSIIERGRFDDAAIADADFSHTSVLSIYVFDPYDTSTTGVLQGEKALQWLFSRGAKVPHPERLNPLMGQPWYEAAREVTRTLERRLVGTHQERSLAKGTTAKYRQFAEEFVNFLVQRRILERVVKSKHGDGWVVKLDPSYNSSITDFSARGTIGEPLRDFFDDRLKRRP